MSEEAQVLLDLITRKTASGIGVRTTEVYDLVEPLAELVAHEYVKFCTETFRSYCWIVPSRYDINRRTAGFFHMDKVYVPPKEAFGLRYDWLRTLEVANAKCHDQPY